MKKGKFIVIEGGDGSGKTTEVELLKKSLDKAGYRVIYTREPGGTKLGEKIRRLLLHDKTVKISPFTEAFLFNTARSVWIEEIVAPALKKGNIVLTDRSYPSTYAYQGVAGGVALEQIDRLNKIAMLEYVPDLIIVIDLDYRTAESRRSKARIATDKIESRAKNYHEKVYSGFRQFAKNHSNAILINGRKNIKSVHKEIIKVINKRLKLKNVAEGI